MPAMKLLCVAVFIHVLTGCQCLESGQGQAAGKCAEYSYMFIATCSHVTNSTPGRGTYERRGSPRAKERQTTIHCASSRLQPAGS